MIPLVESSYYYYTFIKDSNVDQSDKEEIFVVNQDSKLLTQKLKRTLSKSTIFDESITQKTFNLETYFSNFESNDSIVINFINDSNQKLEYLIIDLQSGENIVQFLLREKWKKSVTTKLGTIWMIRKPNKRIKDMNYVGEKGGHCTCNTNKYVGNEIYEIGAYNNNCNELACHDYIEIDQDCPPSKNNEGVFGVWSNVEVSCDSKV